MDITITATAVARLRELLARQDNDARIRISIVKVACG